MPKLFNMQRLSPHLVIGVQVGPGATETDKDKKGVWTARAQIEGTTRYRSTKERYEGGSPSAKLRAEKRAFEWYEEISRARAVGLDWKTTDSPIHLLYKADGYLEEIKELAEVNEREKELGRDPVHRVIGGYAYYNRKQVAAHARDWAKHIDGFYRQDKFLNSKGNIKSVGFFSERDYDGFDAYLMDKSPDLSIETRLKLGLELRRFLKWCKHRGLLQSVPTFKRPLRGGVRGARKRMRREITPDDYRKIIQWTRDNYTASYDDNEMTKHYRDYQYLFHLWVLIIANTGIRPPTGGYDHTLMKWENVKINTDNEKYPTLTRPDEKGHSYTAVIMPQAVTYFDELRRFYEAKQMKTDKGPLFAHWYTNKANTSKGIKRGWKRGDPIYSFRHQWVKMVRELGLAPPKGVRVPQSERCSPSSLRVWFITQRLYSDDRIDYPTLASVTGTSIQQLEERYHRIDVQRSYEYLTAGGYTTGDRPRKYQTIGNFDYYVGHED